MRKLLSAITVCLLAMHVSGQTDSCIDNTDLLLNDQVEEIAASSDVTLDFTSLLDNLNYYVEHRLNLNNASDQELENFPLLNPLQVEALKKHIAENGPLLALQELQSIDGLDLSTIYRILPYIYIGDNTGEKGITIKRLTEEGTGTLFLRFQQAIEKAKGFTAKNPEVNDTSRYLGSRARIYTRFNYRLGNQLSIGFTGQKDAGEQFIKGSEPSGFDFNSAHIYYHGNGLIKSIIVGDYLAQYGQGLTMGTGLTFGKSYDIMNVKKNGYGILPYNSANENLFMRGAALSVGRKHITMDLFYSNHKIDGNVSTDSLTQEQVTSSLITTGYHRTDTELQNKHSIGESLYGCHLQLNQRKLKVGLTTYSMNFDHDYQKKWQPYNQFQFRGSTNSNAGIDYNYIVHNFNLFGELAVSKNGAFAGMTGALISLDRNLGLSILYRNYDRKYQNLFSNAFGEGSGNQGESGLYIGLVTKIANDITINGYFDQFSFSWLRYLVNAPSKGNDYMLQLHYLPSRMFEAYLRIRQKNKAGNLTDDAIANIVTISQANYRLHLKYAVSKRFTFSNRVEYVTYFKGNDTRNTGFLIYQDISYKPIGSKIAGSLRYSLFDADSYYSRIYTYENDLLYAYSIPFYYNKGSRFYITLHYRVVKGLDAWFHYSITVYNNQASLGTGLDQVTGNQKSDFGVELILKY